MSTFSAAELRKWAADMEKYYGLSNRAEVLIRVEAHAARMRARADLIDARAGESTGIADKAEVVQNCPIIGEVRIRGGRRLISIEREYNVEGEKCGIYTAWEWRDDPSAEERAGSLCRLYVGTEQQGPVAMYDADDQQWYALTSRGNFGKRYACGGSWSSKKIDAAPKIIKKLEDIVNRKERIKQAEMKLQAANMRVRAAHLMSNASAHDRQAMNPIYDGQEVVCMSKAEIIRAIADKLLAEADLIEARAE